MDNHNKLLFLKSYKALCEKYGMEVATDGTFDIESIEGFRDLDYIQDAIDDLLPFEPKYTVKDQFIALNNPEWRAEIVEIRDRCYSVGLYEKGAIVRYTLLTQKELDKYYKKTSDL